MTRGNIRVHLVHGTWAKGVSGAATAWTEQGHPAYTTLRAALPAGTVIETFLWSGRNSISGRRAAASDLNRHLDAALRANPWDAHVVVAHSHGGTVASQALSAPNIDGRVRALICLATPFTYVVKSSLARIQTAVVAATSLANAAWWTAALAMFPDISRRFGSSGFGLLVLLSCVVAFAIVLPIAKWTEDNSLTELPAGPRCTPVFLLRGSRDEATSLLSAVQLFDWACSSFARFHDMTAPSVRRPVTWLAFALIYLSCASAGALMINSLRTGILSQVASEAAWWLGLYVYAPAAAGLVYLFGYAAISAAAGHWNLKTWFTSAIDFEVAPPQSVCEIRVFWAVKTSNLRHRLYEDDRVLKTVAELVISASGPSLASQAHA
jgi:pimeloyl-ACP methyl ester carboxylesterase